MRAELLIGLEGMIADLGDVYAEALEYTDLAPRAEGELLPAIEGVGSRLRHMLRDATLSEVEVEQAANEVRALQERWRRAVDEIVRSTTYADATAALEAGDGGTLDRLIPALFAGLTPSAAPSVYIATPVTTGRRKPGVSPFLTVEACVDRLEELCRTGLPADEGDESLPYVSAADDPLLMAGPIGLEIAPRANGLPIFQQRLQPFYRIYARRVPGPFTVVLAQDADDDWWQTHEVAYATFRDNLAERLAARRLAWRIVGAQVVPGSV